MHQKYFLKKELAKRYKVSVSTIERWVYLKNLPPPIRIGLIEFSGICKKY